MDSSPDLSVKLRRGSSDSRDNFYMGFAQGIDSDIEEVTTIQTVPSPPPDFPAPEEPPIDLPLETDDKREEEEVKEMTEVVVVTAEEELEQLPDEEKIEEKIEEFPIPPAPQFQPSIDEDEDETITSVTVIAPTKYKSPSSSSSSISSTENELNDVDESRNKSPPKLTDLSLPSPPISPPPPLQFIENPSSPQQSIKSPPSKKSHSSSRKSPSSSSLASHKSPPHSQKSVSIQKSPPKKLDLHRNDSDSLDSINAIDCKIDDDNRDDSSPTDSMPPIPTPPPLEPLTLLEKR